MPARGLRWPRGYETLLAALAAPDEAAGHARERLDWAPAGFDPEEFSATETDRRVHATMGSSRRAVLPAEVTDAFGDLIRMSPWAPGFALTDLVVAARVVDDSLPDAETRARMVRPWLHLLDVVGADGTTLTQAGYLKPVVVSELAEVPDVPSWMGKANREEHAWPVTALRETAVELGLVRKHKGKLVRSPAGRKVAGDAEAMRELLV